jgi:hypothetical protein
MELFCEELVVESESGIRADMNFGGKPLPIEDISVEDGQRTVTGIAEVDRVRGAALSAVPPY